MSGKSFVHQFWITLAASFITASSLVLAICFFFVAHQT